ncbi:transmembrane protein 216 isoform X1 [Mesocricetus auratus]|uniref:Transmembrane protein 216 n=1 Tax=Mesocricetus auratus TaxID=10036 RepID=A0ABM2XRG5_MESAU|nr:transmembrane protein 216 isoform X1 [Mesocricetus auratus]
MSQEIGEYRRVINTRDRQTDGSMKKVLRRAQARVTEWESLLTDFRVDKRLSSTPLEVLFFLNGWYYATYFLLELLIFLYKGLLLPYPTANLVLDVVMLLLYLGIEVIRLFFGTKGNLCQRKMPLGISVALTFPSAMMASYYLLLQTYVLRLEAIMNSILLFFCGSELLLEMLTLATFSSMDRI